MLSATMRAIMVSHVNYLCTLYNLDKVYITSPEAAEIWIDERMVWVPELTGPVSYYIGLHEIGHFATYHRSEDKLEKEAHAWNWALDVGKIGATKPVYGRIARSLKLHRKLSANVAPDIFNELLEKVEARI